MASSKPNQRKREKPVLQEARPRTSPEGLMLTLGHQDTDHTDAVITTWPRGQALF